MTLRMLTFNVQNGEFTCVDNPFDAEPNDLMTFRTDPNSEVDIITVSVAGGIFADQPVEFAVVIDNPIDQQVMPNPPEEWGLDIVIGTGKAAHPFPEQIKKKKVPTP